MVVYQGTRYRQLAPLALRSRGRRVATGLLTTCVAQRRAQTSLLQSAAYLHRYLAVAVCVQLLEHLAEPYEEEEEEDEEDEGDASREKMQTQAQTDTDEDGSLGYNRHAVCGVRCTPYVEMR